MPRRTAPLRAPSPSTAGDPRGSRTGGRTCRARTATATATRTAPARPSTRRSTSSSPPRQRLRAPRRELRGVCRLHRLAPPRDAQPPGHGPLGKPPRLPRRPGVVQPVGGDRLALAGELVRLVGAVAPGRRRRGGRPAEVAGAVGARVGARVAHAAAGVCRAPRGRGRRRVRRRGVCRGGCRARRVGDGVGSPRRDGTVHTRTGGDLTRAAVDIAAFAVLSAGRDLSGPLLSRSALIDEGVRSTCRAREPRAAGASWGDLHNYRVLRESVCNSRGESAVLYAPPRPRHQRASCPRRARREPQDGREAARMRQKGRRMPPLTPA